MPDINEEKINDSKEQLKNMLQSKVSKTEGESNNIRLLIPPEKVTTILINITKPIEK